MLEFKQVSKVYESNKGIYDCSWKAKKGEITGILGENGCGKTTTFRIILGLQNLDSGCVLYEHQEIRKLSMKKFGYVPEHCSLYQDVRVDELLVLIARIKGIKAEKVNQRIDEWLNYFELIRYKYKKIRELSKGNQQLIQLICGMIHEPEILILDEPFNGLDRNHQKQVIDLLHQIKRKCVILVSFHQYELMHRVCDRIIEMESGRVKGEKILCGV
ncbi:MAG: ATP-binding cassette domain-containing protein [Erysipelotrichaceae bacterium]|nr:ATP-binding cassette domain-containing protein [Erysipelotrichaceae bacterium]